MLDFVDAVELEPEVIRSEYERRRDTASRYCESIRTASDGHHIMKGLEKAQRQIAFMEQLRVAFYYLTGDLLGSETGTGHSGRRLTLEMLPKYPVPPAANLPLAEAIELAKEYLLESFPELQSYIDEL